MDEKVEAFNETLLNIYQNYIPNKKIKCNYCQPSWMTDNIKKSLKGRSKLTEKFYKNSQRKTDREKVSEKATECTNEILEVKKNILKMSKKLEDSKAYWTILNRLIYSKKIPAIPLLFVDGNFISDFCVKVNIFNNYFALILHQ